MFGRISTLCLYSHIDHSPFSCQPHTHVATLTRTHCLEIAAIYKELALCSSYHIPPPSLTLCSSILSMAAIFSIYYQLYSLRRQSMQLLQPISMLCCQRMSAYVQMFQTTWMYACICMCLSVWQCAVMCKWRLFCLLFAHPPCFACVSASLLVVCDLVFVHSFFFCNAAVYVSQSINQSISVWIGRAIGIFFCPTCPQLFSLFYFYYIFSLLVIIEAFFQHSAGHFN